MITYALLNLKSIKNGGPVISPISPLVVIPVKTGIQWIQIVLDSGFRRSDGFLSFYETIKNDVVLIYK